VGYGSENSSLLVEAEPQSPRNRRGGLVLVREPSYWLPLVRRRAWNLVRHRVGCAWWRCAKAKFAYGAVSSLFAQRCILPCNILLQWGVVAL